MYLFNRKPSHDIYSGLNNSLPGIPHNGFLRCTTAGQRVILNKQPSMSNLVFNWVLDCVRNKLAILLDIDADSAVSGAGGARMPFRLPATAGVLYLGNNQMLQKVLHNGYSDTTATATELKPASGSQRRSLCTPTYCCSSTL